MLKGVKQFYDLSGSIVEIGIGKEISLPMWLNMFKNAHIYGVDSLSKNSINNSNCTVFQADQSNINELNNLKSKLIDKNVFFINDDGSHIPEHQLLTFNVLFPILLEGGIYIIEDIETSYWTKGTCYDYKTEYGVKHLNSIIEIFKDSIDIVNREFINKQLKTQLLHHDYIESVTFFRNCIIIKKNYNSKRDYRFKCYVE